MMPAQKIIDNEFATLFYHPDAKIVHHTFHKPLSGAPFREVLTTGIELLKQHGAVKWLSDDRNNSALSPEDSEWGQTTFFMEAKAAGWTTWALVVPHDVMGRLDMKTYIDQFFAQGIRVMVFTNPDKALEWLIAQ